MAEIKDLNGNVDAILAETAEGRVLLDAVTGRKKYYVSDNGEIKNAITGRTAYIFLGDLPGGGNGGIDVSDTTATAPDVLEGKKFYDADGQPTIGTLVQGGTATYYKCAEVGMPFEMPEPVFSAPLTAQSDTAETGQSLTTTGTVTFQEVDGKQCAYLDGNASYITTDNTTGLPAGSSARSVACYVRYTQFNDISIISYGTASDNQRYGVGFDLNGNLCIWGYNNNATFTGYTLELNKWCFITVTFKNDVAKLYIAGQYIEQVAQSGLDTGTDELVIGGEADQGNETTFNGYIADVQIYNTALTAEQVMKLYDPTYEPPEALAPYTWSGYKAFLVEDTENNKTYYDFETELTTDALTWGKAFTPQVDSVYDAEVMVKVAVYTAGQYPEIASPQNMTGYTQGDWVVSASSERFSDIPAYGAFGGGVWYGYDSNPWLQWQNTLQKVLIRQLSFGYGGVDDKIYTCKFMGSDDGTNWIEIGTRDCEYSGDKNITTLTFPDNETPYYYHRLYSVSDSGTAVVMFLVAKRDID